MVTFVILPLSSLPPSHFCVRSPCLFYLYSHRQCRWVCVYSKNKYQAHTQLSSTVSYIHTYCTCSDPAQLTSTHPWQCLCSPFEPLTVQLLLLTVLSCLPLSRCCRGPCPLGWLSLCGSNAVSAEAVRWTTVAVVRADYVVHCTQLLSIINDHHL